MFYRVRVVNFNFHQQFQFQSTYTHDRKDRMPLCHGKKTEVNLITVHAAKLAMFLNNWRTWNHVHEFWEQKLSNVRLTRNVWSRLTNTYFYMNILIKYQLTSVISSFGWNLQYHHNVKYVLITITLITGLMTNKISFLWNTLDVTCLCMVVL